MHWFEKSVFYEVYMKSFCDGNQDGVGDFIGLKERLPYLRKLGFGLRRFIRPCKWIMAMMFRIIKQLIRYTERWMTFAIL